MPDKVSSKTLSKKGLGCNETKRNKNNNKPCDDSITCCCNDNRNAASSDAGNVAWDYAWSVWYHAYN